MARFRSVRGRALKQWMKSPGALVTDADVESDRLIAATLREHGVPGRLLSEESKSGRTDGKLTWLIDPLCGTYPFSTGMTHWGVNIALRRGGQFEVAALALPAIKEQLAMARGKGVTRNGRAWSPKPSPFVGAKFGDVAVGLEIDGGEMRRRLMNHGLDWATQCAQTYSFASAAYPMGLICLGRLAAFVIYGVEPVHLAAGSAIALELGLDVTDDRGAPIDWSSDGELPVVVAGWPSVHAQLIAAMRGL